MQVAASRIHQSPTPLMGHRLSFAHLRDCALSSGIDPWTESSELATLRHVYLAQGCPLLSVKTNKLTNRTKKISFWPLPEPLSHASKYNVFLLNRTSWCTIHFAGLFLGHRRTMDNRKVASHIRCKEPLEVLHPAAEQEWRGLAGVLGKRSPRSPET